MEKKPRQTARGHRGLGGFRSGANPMEDLFLESSRRRSLNRANGEQVSGILETPHQLAQFGVAEHFGLECPRLALGQCAQRVEARHFVLLLGDHTYCCRLSRSFNMPRRMRALMVPNGSFMTSAISGCVKPPKKASSMAWRCSAGRLLTAERMAASSSSGRPNDPETFSTGAAWPLSWKSVTSRERRWRARRRSIDRFRAMLKA